MKRNLIALAVAGAFLAPAAAMADGSGIVLTGLVHGDIGFGYEKADGGGVVYKRQPNIGTFATRWEIDGTEDLGWAQAIFGLAMDQKFAGSARAGGGQNTNNNNIGDLNNRNSFLGLTGGFGTIKIGQNEHLYEIQQILQDPDPASENTFSTLSLMTSWGGVHNGFTRRDAQSIWYASPNIGGATIEAAYITSAGGKKDGVTTTTTSGGVTDCSLTALGVSKGAPIGIDQNGNNVFPTAGGCFVSPVVATTTTSDALSPYGIQLGANWKAPFGLSLYGAYAQYNDDDGRKSKNKAFRLGAGFGTELFQVDVFGEQLKYTASNTNDKRTNIGVSGALNFGQHHIRGAVSVAGKLKSGGSSVPDSSARLILVGYAYTLSKRTELQVNYGLVDNKKNASFNVGANGNDANRFGVGIRHTF
jgi:predicted porin